MSIRVVKFPRAGQNIRLKHTVKEIKIDIVLSRQKLGLILENVFSRFSRLKLSKNVLINLYCFIKKLREI
jgi:hypothetical protein